jgi:hypothetical protein
MISFANVSQEHAEVLLLHCWLDKTSEGSEDFRHFPSIRLLSSSQMFRKKMKEKR